MQFLWTNLMRPELIDKMMHVDKEQICILNFLISFRRLRALDQDINQVQEVDQDWMIQFPEFFFPVNIFCRVQSLDALTNQTTNVLTNKENTTK